MRNWHQHEQIGKKMAFVHVHKSQFALMKAIHEQGDYAINVIKASAIPVLFISRIFRYFANSNEFSLTADTALDKEIDWLKIGRAGYLLLLNSQGYLLLTRTRPSFSPRSQVSQVQQQG